MASPLLLSYRNVLFHNGSLHGIAGNTVVFEFTAEGTADLAPLTPVTDELWKSYPFPFLAQVWFRRAVRETGEPDIASWLTALVVAFQWQAGDPVGPGRVVAVMDGKFTIAAPWERREVFSAALMLATRFLSLWLRRPAPSGEDCAKLLIELDDWLLKVRPGHLHENARRLVIAARARNVPVAAHPHDGLDFGWGRLRRSLLDTNSKAEKLSYERLALRTALAGAGFATVEYFLPQDVDGALRVAEDRPYPFHVSEMSASTTDWTLNLVSNAAELRSRVEEITKSKGTVALMQTVPTGDLYHFICVDGRIVFVSSLRESKAPMKGHYWADVTGQVNHSTRQLVERYARSLGRDIILIAMQIPDITQLIDIYSSNPGVVSDCVPLRYFPEYLFRVAGVDLAWVMVSKLLEGKSGRIPIAAVSAAFGAATTSRMLVSIWIAAGKTPGLSSPGALFVGSQQISQTSLAPEQSVRALFAQRDVEAIVFEVPESGLFDNGNPCDHYDVAALLNFQPGAAAQRGADVVNRLLVLKGVPLETVSGAVVLNAEDDAVMSLSSRIACRRRVLVSSASQEGAALRDHLNEGGEAVVLEQREGKPWIMLAHGRSRSPIMAVSEIPSSADGTIQSIVKQALFASALGIAHDLPNDVIRRGLIAFSPDA